MGRVRYPGNKAQGSIRIADYANIVDGEKIVIGNKTYEWDDDASVDPGNVLVTIGATDALSISALVAAINGNKPTPAVTAAVDSKDTKTCRLVADSVGTAGNMALTENTTDADAVVVSGATLVGGENGGSQRDARGQYTVTAIDVSADQLVIQTPMASPRFAEVQLRSSAGVPKAHTGEITISGSKIVLNFAGATDPAAGDVATWECWE